MAHAAPIPDARGRAQHGGPCRRRRDLDDCHRRAASLADEPNRSPRARVLERRRVAAAGDPIVYRRRGDGRRVWATRHAAIGAGAIRGRAAALDLRVYRVVADPDALHVSLRLSHRTSGIAEPRSIAGRGRPLSRLRSLADLPRGHPAAASSGGGGRRRIDGALHPGRFRGRHPAPLRCLHARDLCPIPVGPGSEQRGAAGAAAGRHLDCCPRRRAARPRQRHDSSPRQRRRPARAAGRPGVRANPGRAVLCAGRRVRARPPHGDPYGVAAALTWRGASISPVSGRPPSIR